MYEMIVHVHVHLWAWADDVDTYTCGQGWRAECVKL